MPIFLHRHLTAKYPILEGDELLRYLMAKYLQLVTAEFKMKVYTEQRKRRKMK